MYVCLCKGITEEMVQKALNKNPHTGDALRSLGVGSDCGICLLETIEKVKQSQANKANSKSASKNHSSS